LLNGLDILVVLYILLLVVVIKEGFKRGSVIASRGRVQVVAESIFVPVVVEIL
jgi:hypothetical protein